MEDNSMMLPVGTILRERYRIDKYLASGGFGNTYKVHDVHLNEDCVIKEFFCRTINSRDKDTHTVTVSNPSNTADFEGLIGKFRKEALRIRALKGEHIVHVHDLFDENGTAYYVMDFIDGESLSDVLKRRGPLPEAEVLGYLEQMLDALDETHRHSIWHLDIKPGNMMLDRDGNLKLIDFGASKLVDPTGGAMTTSMAMAYTPGYAPVEQTEQKIEAIGAHTDLYAVGATLYNLLTGERPPSMTDMIAEGDDAFHYPADVSQSTRQLIRGLMQIHSVNRPQNVAQVRQMLGKNGSKQTSGYEATMLKAQPTEPHKASTSTTETPKAFKKKWVKPTMGFVEAIKICFQKYANFKGRARRSEFWWFYLCCSIVNCIFYFPFNALMAKKTALIQEGTNIALSGGDLSAIEAQDPTSTIILVCVIWGIIALLLFIPQLAAMVRRLHDTGKSGNLCWLFLLCGIGGIVPLVMCIPDGQPQPNQYGESPKYVAPAGPMV